MPKKPPVVFLSGLSKQKITQKQSILYPYPRIYSISYGIGRICNIIATLCSVSILSVVYAIFTNRICLGLDKDDYFGKEIELCKGKLFESFMLAGYYG